jgi:hypothetical protein
VSVSFIQSLYNPSSPLPTDEKVYKKMLADDDFISVAPQVYHLIKEQGRLEATPLFFQEHIKTEFKKAFYQNLFIKNQIEQILMRFEEEAIEVIPLKGPFFAEKYFGHIGARSTSDIDLLIKLQDLEQAKLIVKKLGYSTEEEKIEGHFHCGFSKVLPGSPIPLTVELHWHLLKENTARFDVNELWNEATPFRSYKSIKELSIYHTFYMICLHSWRHNLDSLRHFLDIVQLMFTLENELDFQQLRMNSEVHQTSKRIIRTLSLVYQVLPNLQVVKNCPIIKKKQFLREIAFLNRHKIGIWKYIDFIDYQFFSYDTLRHSFMQIKNLFR